MKRVLFDVNVVLDVLPERKLFVEGSTAKAKRIVSSILRVFRVASVHGAVLQEVLQLPFADFEDAVTAAVARLAGRDYMKLFSRCWAANEPRLLDKSRRIPPTARSGVASLLPPRSAMLGLPGLAASCLAR